MTSFHGTSGIPGKGIPPRVEPQAPSAPPARPAGGGKSDFASLLEKLRSLEKETRSSGLEGAEKDEKKPLDPAALLRRLEEAERTFRKAMEIRRDLEEAWRSAGKGGYGSPGKEGP